MVGLWVGTFTANNDPAAGSLNYKFDTRADGTIITQSQGADGFTNNNQGTWIPASDTTFTDTTISITNGISVSFIQSRQFTVGKMPPCLTKFGKIKIVLLNAHSD